MPPTMKITGESIVSSRRSKGARALANITSSALNSRGLDGSGGGKHGQKSRCNKNEQGESINTDDVSIEEIGRRMTRSMTLTSSTGTATAKPAGDLSKKRSSRRVRRLAPPDRSTMRTTRSMTLRDKRLLASKISIDCIANVATYLQPNNDAMNVCLAVGPEAAQIVRTRYLLHDKCNHWSDSSTSFLYRAVNDLSRNRRCQMIDEWVLVNKRKACLWFLYGRDYRFAPPLVSMNETTWTFSLAPIIANPGLAVALGLFGLVVSHVQRSGFDVNGLYNSELKVSGDADVGREENRCHLIHIAMVHDQVKIFDALLAHPRIELSGPIKTFDDPRRHLIFYALLSKSSNRSYFLREIATHRNFRINEPIRLDERFVLTPLLWLIPRYSSERFRSSPRWSVEIIEILIEAGADVHLEVENLRSPCTAMLHATLAIFEERSESGDYTDDDINRYLEALSVVEKWPASMKINGLVRGFLARRRLAAAVSTTSKR